MKNPYRVGQSVRVRRTGQVGMVAHTYPGGTCFVSIEGEPSGSDAPCYFNPAQLEPLTNTAQ